MNTNILFFIRYNSSCPDFTVPCAKREQLQAAQLILYALHVLCFTLSICNAEVMQSNRKEFREFLCKLAEEITTKRKDAKPTKASTSFSTFSQLKL